jgi:hypothetical protein
MHSRPYFKKYSIYTWVEKLIFTNVGVGRRTSDRACISHRMDELLVNHNTVLDGQATLPVEGVEHTQIFELHFSLPG